jgi:hypothetical protein
VAEDLLAAGSTKKLLQTRMDRYVAWVKRDNG